MQYSDFRYLPPLVQEYLNYCSVTRGKSRLTVCEYASDLRLFFRYLICIKNNFNENELDENYDMSFIDLDYISKITFSDANNFIAYCVHVRNNDISTRSRKISSIRGFYKFLTVNRRLLDENPMLQLETPKPQKSLPKYLTLEQSKQLLNSVDGKYKQRDYCMLTLLLNCGMRLAELVGINISDIDFDQQIIRITGKGNKQRMVYLNKACMESIYEYLKVRPHEGVKAADKNALFISHQKRRISRRMVQDVVYEYLDKIGLSGQGYSVHKLRHTAATLMYQYGDVDVLVLKDMLGHENLSTTEIYTHLMNKQLRDAAKSNPLSGESTANETDNDFKQTE
ncbi:MAG: tyrosine recombinase XerC [Clostridia bacterium]|nr:tyrosine recombinase XerC [Clostridia bacterium]